MVKIMKALVKIHVASSEFKPSGFLALGMESLNVALVWELFILGAVVAHDLLRIINRWFKFAFKIPWNMNNLLVSEPLLFKN